MYYCGIPEGYSLAHGGKKGMKWGYNDGRRNGKRTAEDLSWADQIRKRKALKAQLEAKKKIETAANKTSTHIKKSIDKYQRKVSPDVKRAAERTSDYIKKSVDEYKRNVSPAIRKAANKTADHIKKSAIDYKQKVGPDIKKAADKTGNYIKKEADYLEPIAKRNAKKDKKKLERIAKNIEKVASKTIADIKEFAEKHANKVISSVTRFKRQTVRDIHAYMRMRRAQRMGRRVVKNVGKLSKAVYKDVVPRNIRRDIKGVSNYYQRELNNARREARKRTKHIRRAIRSIT